MEDVCSTFNLKKQDSIIVDDDEEEGKNEEEESGEEDGRDSNDSYDDQDGASVDSVAQGKRIKRKDDSDSDADYSET